MEKMYKSSDFITSYLIFKFVNVSFDSTEC